jgi:predicted transposase/invertase (TIGR01784 family)
MNNNQLLNLEMQVKNEFNWADRSLTYLCRAFDQLQSGQEYEDTLPVIHIGFTDFTLFPDNPEFYASYRMINVRNHDQVFSDKFTLSVVDLTQIDRATEEDKSSKIDYWARLFKAKTWEELQMLAQNDEYLQEAAASIRIANEAEIVREQCRAREDAIRRERTLERDKNRLLAENAALLEERTSQHEKISSLQDENASLQDENASLRKQLAEFQKLISKQI